MTIFDLVFIGCALSAAAGLIFLIIQAATGHFRSAGRTLGSLIAGAAIYLGTVSVTGLSATQKVMGLGEAHCFDDWCITPAGATDRGSEVTVEFRVWSRAKRVRQREFGLGPYLQDEDRRIFRILKAEGPAFDQSVGPGDSFLTSRTFLADPRSRTLKLFLRGERITPGTFVIGDSQSLFHPRTAVRIR